MKELLSPFVSREMRELPNALRGIIEIHRRLVKDKLDFLYAYREANNAMKEKVPGHFDLKHLAFIENEFRKDASKLEEETAKCLERLESKGAYHKVYEGDQFTMDQRVQNIKAWFYMKGGPLEKMIVEMEKDIAQIHGITKKKK